jgi:cytoskeletal protein CcmA (bactofilin family)
MPPIFNKRAELEARLGSTGSARRPEPADQGAEETSEERVEQPPAPAMDGRPEPPMELVRPPEAVRPPRTWAEGEGTVLAPGTVLEGTLRAAEPVQVAGTVQGALEAEGPITVEPGGRLVARVVAPEIVVSGFVDGRVQCHGRLEVRSTGLVKGKLHVGTLRIEEGALLDGQLQMAGAVAAASIQTTEPTAAPDLPRARPGKPARAVEAIPDDPPEPLAVNE